MFEVESNHSFYLQSLIGLSLIETTERPNGTASRIFRHLALMEALIEEDIELTMKSQLTKFKSLRDVVKIFSYLYIQIRLRGYSRQG